jgi:hypothetical protein
VLPRIYCVPNLHTLGLFLPWISKR